MNKKSSLIIVITLFFIVVGISIYQAVQYNKNIYNQIKFSFLEELSQKSFNNDKEIEIIYSQVDSIIPLLSKTDSHSKKQIIRNLFKLSSSTLISTAYILDSNGICLYSSSPSFLKKDYSFRPYFSELKMNKDYLYVARGVTSQKFGVYYSKKVVINNIFRGAIVLKSPLNAFSSEIKWINELPNKEKNSIYSGILTQDKILLTTNTEKLFHLSSLSQSLSEKIKNSKQYQREKIINLKILNDYDTYSFISSHRILYRKNIYGEEYIIFSNPIRKGKLLKIHLIPHNIFINNFNNKNTVFSVIISVFSSPYTVTITLITILLITTLSYKKFVTDLIDSSNIKTAEAAVAKIEKDEFLATVTHELRTPLNGIMGITTLMQESEIPEKQREYLEMINSCSSSLLKIINDVLDISKIRSGVLSLNNTSINLHVLLHEVVTPVEKEANKKGLTFFFNPSDNLPETVIGDNDRIKQILNSFLTNAVKFTDIGTVNLDIIKKNETDNSITVSFSISDTGIGISQEDQERMFEAFTQAEMSTTRHHGGMGLGLSIAKNLSDLMKGDITLNSIPGKGSTFTFTVSLQKDIISHTNNS